MTLLSVCSFLMALGLFPSTMDSSLLGGVLGDVDKLLSTLLGKSNAAQMDAASIEQDAHMSVPDLIEKYGYGCERRNVTTIDGYILQMHRIISSPLLPCKFANQSGRPPVFLMHGLTASSSSWVWMRPGKSIGYLLADLGYDVWMGNARGNRYSRTHVTLNADGDDAERRAYWDFSWHEIGTTDLPTMIDEVLLTTCAAHVHYVGHSQGTTAFFVMASVRPEYNAKILLAQALAPVAFMTHMYSPVLHAAALAVGPLGSAFYATGQYEFLPSNDLMTLGVEIVCDNDITASICENFLFLLMGFDASQYNATMQPIVFGSVPAGQSTKQIVHYGQLIDLVDEFRQYDYGGDENVQYYGSRTPPAYPLEKITAPVALHYATNDWLSAAKDVDLLATKLPNLVGKFLVDYAAFNHLDYILAIDIVQYVFDPMLELMRAAESEHCRRKKSGKKN